MVKFYEDNFRMIMHKCELNHLPEILDSLDALDTKLLNLTKGM